MKNTRIVDRIKKQAQQKAGDIIIRHMQGKITTESAIIEAMAAGIELTKSIVLPDDEQEG